MHSDRRKTQNQSTEARKPSRPQSVKKNQQGKREALARTFFNRRNLKLKDPEKVRVESEAPRSITSKVINFFEQFKIAGKAFAFSWEHNKNPLIQSLALRLPNSVLPVTGAWLTGVLIDTVAGKSAYGFAAGAVVGLWLLQKKAAIFESFFLTKYQHRNSEVTEYESMKSVSTLPIAAHESPEEKEKISLVNRNTWRMSPLNNATVNLLGTGIQFSTALLALGVKAPLVAAGVAVAGLVECYNRLKLSKEQKKNREGS